MHHQPNQDPKKRSKCAQDPEKRVQSSRVTNLRYPTNMLDFQLAWDALWSQKWFPFLSKSIEKKPPSFEPCYAIERLISARTRMSFQFGSGAHLFGGQASWSGVSKEPLRRIGLHPKR